MSSTTIQEQELWINRPFSYIFHGKKNEEPTIRNIVNHLNEQNPGYLWYKTPKHALAPLAFLAGVIGWIFGSKKDSSLLKWVGGILTMVGVVATGLAYFLMGGWCTANKNTIALIPNNLKSSNPRKPIEQNQGSEKIVLDPLEKIYGKTIFQPDKELIDSPANHGIEHTELLIDTKDGEKLHGYFLPAKQKTNKTVIFLHGNAGNVGDWYKACTDIQEHVPVNYLVIDYRGYGKSSGEPSRLGVIRDAEAMYERLIEMGYKSEDISIHGRSLGCGVAAELEKRLRAKNKLLCSMVMESPFTSLQDAVKGLFPFVPGGLVRNDLLNNRDLIKKTRTPVLIVHGDQDEVVSFEQGKELFQLALEPKRFLPLKGAHHNDVENFHDEDYYKALREFFTGTVSVGGIKRANAGNNPEKIKIKKEVVDEIMKTIGNMPYEQGGMLGGNRANGAITHFYFDETGHRNSVEYEPDVEIINLLLSKDWNPKGVNFLGFVHSHPPGVRRPSGGDEKYAKNILAANPTLDQVLLPIVLNPQTPNTKILWYAAKRSGEGVEIVDIEADLT